MKTPVIAAVQQSVFPGHTPYITLVVHSTQANSHNSKGKTAEFNPLPPCLNEILQKHHFNIQLKLEYGNYLCQALNPRMTGLGGAQEWCLLKIAFFSSLISSTPSPPTRQQQASMGQIGTSWGVSVDVTFVDHFKIGDTRDASVKIVDSGSEPHAAALQFPLRLQSHLHDLSSRLKGESLELIGLCCSVSYAKVILSSALSCSFYFLIKYCWWV